MNVFEYGGLIGARKQAVVFEDGSAAVRTLGKGRTELLDDSPDLQERYRGVSTSPRALRRFQLVRREDLTGCTGCGVVAQGVEFGDGSVVMRWLVSPPSTVVRASVAEVVQVHGHEGRTELEFLDPPELPAPPAVDPFWGGVA